MITHHPGAWWGLIFLCAAVSLVIIDVTIINVAVPAIVQDLGTSASTTQWIQEAYTLSLAALLVVAGRVADAAVHARGGRLGSTSSSGRSPRSAPWCSSPSQDNPRAAARSTSWAC